MEMPDVTMALRAAVEEEPPLGFGASDVVARARAMRRRRRGLSVVGSVVAVAGVIVVIVGIAGGGAPARQPSTKSPALSVAAFERAAATRAISRSAKPGRAVSVAGLNAANLPNLVERDTGVTLSPGASVTVLQPGGELDLAAGIDVAGKPYLNVQVIPAHGLITAAPTCAELSNVSSGQGDGYYGPCRIQRLADGSILVVRSGQTATGGFTMAQALLVHPDGSGIFAEDTNQAWTAPRKLIHRLSPAAGPHSRATVRLTAPPVVRAQPVLDSTVMAKLVRDLALQA